MEINLFLPSPTAAADADAAGGAADQRSAAEGRRNGVQTRDAVLSVQAGESPSSPAQPSADAGGRGRIVDITV